MKIFKGITKQQFEDIFVEEITFYNLEDYLENIIKDDVLFEVNVDINEDGKEVANIYTYANGSSFDFAYDIELIYGTLKILERNIEEKEED